LNNLEWPSVRAGRSVSDPVVPSIPFNRASMAGPSADFCSWLGAVVRVLIALASATAVVLPALPQTKLDRQLQARAIDFHGVGLYQSRVRMGGSLPSTCTCGEDYLLGSAPAGSNLYFCLSPNVWVRLGGTGGPRWRPNTYFYVGPAGQYTTIQDYQDGGQTFVGADTFYTRLAQPGIDIENGFFPSITGECSGNTSESILIGSNQGGFIRLNDRDWEDPMP
jgi:hypothetical protein